MPVSANGTKSIASNAATRSKSKAGGTGPGGSGGVRSGTTTNSNTNRSAGQGGQGNTKMGNSTQTGGLLGSRTTTPLGGQGNVNTQSAFSKMNNSTQSGMGFNAPAVANATRGLLGVGGTRGSLTNPGVTSMLGEAQRRNKSNIMESQYSQYRSPPSVNQMAPQAVTDPYGGMGKMGFNSGQTSPYNQPVKSVTDPYGGMGKMGLNSGQTSPYAAPQGLQSNLGYQDPQTLEARARAVSRGPGSVAGVMPGASALSQERTLQTLAGSMNEDPRFNGKQFSVGGLRNLSRTMAGEAGNESPMGQTAAANTMVNRMALAAENPKKYGYMGGTSIDSLMGQYDATGMRKGTAPNSAFKAAVPGTDALGNGIASLAGSLASNSNFTQTAPASVQNATHFLTDKAMREQAKRPQGPTNWSNDPNNPFTKYGAHNFGTAENIGSQVASVRGFTGQPTGPTQVASISPTVAPPSQQQVPTITDTPAGSWMDALPGAEYAKKAISYVDEKLVQPTQEQIAKYGGFERAGKLAQAAVGVMNAFGNISISPGSFGPGGGDRDNGAMGIRNRQEAEAAAATPTVTTPPVTPTVNPMQPWLYPQYSQQWAGLPTGIGGYARG